MKIQDIIKRQTTVIALAIVLISIALIGVSYAIFFDVKSNEQNQIIKAGTLQLSISGVNENNPINVSNVISLEEAKELEPISYTISNLNSDIPATYKIYLYTNETDTVNHNYIYVSLSDDGNIFTEPVILSSLIDKEGSYSENEVNYYKLESGVLEIGAQTETKYLKIWLDESLINEDIINKKTNFKLNIVTEAGGVKDYILAHSKIGEGTPDFSKVSYSTCDNTTDVNCEATVGIYKAEDDDGTTYYYRGDVTDNYMKFAGFYWRIIRINGNGSIRMIYAGDASAIDNLENREEVLSNGYDDSSTNYANVGQSSFNKYSDDNAYVGFMYTVGEIRGTGTKSMILTDSLEPWYEEKFLNTKYEQYIDVESGFCGDRSAYLDSKGLNLGGGTGQTNTYYGAYTRLFANNQKITYKCQDIDLYTKKNTAKGNQKLDYLIGLITADEVAYAGSGVNGKINPNYYLNTNSDYWTLSPSWFSENQARIITVMNNGGMGYGAQSHIPIKVRPVININGNKLAGSGTINDPYYIP